MCVCFVEDKCCMCRNCYRVCKFGAISYVTDEYGFEYAVVNKEKCVGCKQCEIVCPVINNHEKQHEVYKCGIAYALNSEIKKNGSSGGLFGCFANAVIGMGGIVYGAAFNKDLKLVTTRVESEDELKPLFKSKYLLCDTDSQFEKIESDLKTDKTVLYCSSPCQIKALKLFLKKDYDKLITIDFVCHGVSSQEIFNRFLEIYEKKHECKLDVFQFRNKVMKPSSSHYFKLSYFKDGRKIEKKGLYYSYPYYNAYCKQIISRPNCYECEFARKDRVSDITIGDFHTIEKYFTDIDRFDGISMFLCNSKKGMEFFEACKDDLYTRDMAPEILYSNNRFSKSTKSEVESSIVKSREFLSEFLEHGFSKKIKKTLFTKKDFLKMVYYNTPSFLRKIVKGMVH